VAAADAAAHRAIEAVWRIECARIVATVARLTRDIGLAEECAQDALVSALEHWPTDGTPTKPGAWLTATAKNRALDHLRHHALRDRKLEELGHDLQAQEALIVPDFVDALDATRQDSVGDDLLRLIFIACHPVLPADGRVALTLRLLGGLDTAEIASAFLVAEATIAQRIVRAKKTLAAAHVPFELPAADALAARLGSVLEVIYLVFNEGYAATHGATWTRPTLCDEAVRLGRVLAALAPLEPEVLGLQALMELQASRMAARTGASGAPVLLLDQDRGRWDRLLIRRGLSALERAQALSAAAGSTPGPYALQAAIAACHARAGVAAQTDWPRIAALYGDLAQAQASPVVELNRAVAVAMAEGPAAGLAIVDRLAAEPRLQGYPWLPSVRGDLLARLGRADEARSEFERAAGLTRNERDRALLLARAHALVAAATLPDPPAK
jgi:RNA polymerase sigma factor (sigma-70 family)